MDPESLLESGVPRHYGEENVEPRLSVETGAHRHSVETIKTEPLTLTDKAESPAVRRRIRNRLIVRLWFDLTQFDPNYDPRQKEVSEEEGLENSPYAEVRAAVPNADDPNVHCVYPIESEPDVEHTSNVDNRVSFYCSRIWDQYAPFDETAEYHHYIYRRSVIVISDWQGLGKVDAKLENAILWIHVRIEPLSVQYQRAYSHCGTTMPLFTF
jgi:hypothetical protein